MPNRLNIADLVVVDFYADRKELSEDMRYWMDSHLNSRVFCAENCERRIWLGDAESFKSFPIHDLKRYRATEIHTGKNAYAFMLTYATGFANPHGLDRPAHDRFYSAWAKLSARKSGDREKYSDLITLLVRDAAFIKSNITNQVRPVRPWLIAREASSQGFQSNIVVIGELNGDRTGITDVTKRILTTANGQYMETPASLTYMFPDDPEGEIAIPEIQRLIDRGKLRIPEVHHAQFDDFSQIIEQTDVVYAAAVPGTNPENDIFIAHCWKNRIETGNVMVHVNITVEGDERAFRWLNGHVPASEIRQKHLDRQTAYEIAKQATQDTAAHFAECRLQRRSPCRETVRAELGSTLLTI